MPNFKRILFFTALAVSFCSTITADPSHKDKEGLFDDNKIINKSGKGNLTLSIDNLHFFHDNEYWGGRASGYTLPGFYFQPSVGFQPTKNLKIDAGIYIRHYWGATEYPQIIFSDVLRTVSGNEKSKIQVKPFMRIQAKIGNAVNIVFGNIYGGTNHNLPDPLYNYERIMTEYPETGLQILVNTTYFNMDTWINWESFIFRNDNHQEAFTFGVTTKTSVNPEKSKVHVYFPVNAIFQHRGGEIDTIPTHRVQTWMNLSAGTGISFRIGNKIFRKMSLEATAAYYMEIEDNLMPFEKGFLIHGKIWADIWRFKIGAAYWKAYDFISLLGNPYFGAIHVPYNGNTMKNPEVGSINMEYIQKFGKSCAFGFKADLYCTRECKSVTNTGITGNIGKNIGFTAGAYIRFTPTFVLAKIKKYK